MDRPKQTDEDIALHLVKLYFEEVARLGFKRKVDLDTIISAYIYTLEKVKSKRMENESHRAEIPELLTKEETLKEYI